MMSNRYNDKRANTFTYIGTPKAARWIKKSYSYRFNMIMGPVRSSKDYNATIAFIEQVKNADFDLFLIAAVDVKNCLRIQGRYILNYLGGLAKKTLYMEAPAIQFPYNGMTKTIIFAGGKNNGSDAGIQGLTLHSIYFTEINLLNEDFISQAIKRTSSFKDAKIFGTFNPKGPKHYFRTKFLNMWEEYQKNNPDKKWLNFERFTLYDNPILDEEMIETIKASYDPTSVSYKRDIEGIETDPEGALYTIRDYNLIDEINFREYNRYVTVMDSADDRSATVFLLGAIRFNTEKNQNELYILREYFHINNTNDIQKKTTQQRIDDYVIFIQEAIELFNGKHPDVVLFDNNSSEFFRDLRQTLMQNKLGQHVPKRVAKDTEEERIYKMQSWLYKGKLRIYKHLTHTIEDFKNAVYDEKAYERTGVISMKNDYTEKGHMDCVDATSYIVRYYTGIIK